MLWLMNVMFLLRIVQYRAPGRIDVNRPSAGFCHKNRVRHWRMEVFIPILWVLPTLQEWSLSGLPAVLGGELWFRLFGRNRCATRRRAWSLLWPIIVCRPHPSCRAQSGESSQRTSAGIAGAVGLLATDGCRHRDELTRGSRRIKRRRFWRRLGWSGGGDGRAHCQSQNDHRRVISIYENHSIAFSCPHQMPDQMLAQIHRRTSDRQSLCRMGATPK